LPTGASFANGVISGTVAEPGTSPIAVTANDGKGGVTSTVFDLSITPTSQPTGNLLVNGSLEQSTLTAGQYKAFTSIPGWTAIPGGTIELWRALNGVNAPDGFNFAELDYTSGFDGFQQVVQTSAGQTYTLTFDARLRPSTSASTQAVEVLWNGQRAGLITPDSTWKPYSLVVAGSGLQDTLTIREFTGQSGDGRGALLDNFRLVAQPTSTAPMASFDEKGVTLSNAADFWML
jgi:hypothetical protein